MSNHAILASMLEPPAWMASIDLQDAYFHIPVKPTLHKYLAFLHQEKLYFFRVLPFGLTVYLHEGTALCSCATTQARHSSSRLHRRLGGLGTLSKRNLCSLYNYNKSTSKIRLPNKHDKISTQASHRRRMVGSTLASSGRPLGNSSGKTRKYFAPHEKPFQSSNLLTQRMGRHSWLPCFRNSNPHSTASQTPAVTTTPTLRPLRFQRPPGSHPSSPEARSPSMDNPTFTRTNGIFSFRSHSCPPLDGRVSVRLGRPHRDTQRFRNLESPREAHAYQLVRSQGSALHLTTARSMPQNHPTIHRQCSCAVCNKQAFLQIPESVDRNSPTCPASTGKEPENTSFTHINSPEQQSGCSEPLFLSSLRMGTTTSSLSPSGIHARAHGDRPYGNSPEFQDTSIHLPIPRCTSFGPERSSLGLEPVVPSLPLSSQMVHSQNNFQTTNLQKPRVDYTPMVSSGTVVPVHNQPSSPILAPKPTRSNEEWTARLREVDRLQFLKEVFAATLGDTVASHLVAAHRDSTIKQAQSVWKAFQKWLPATTRIISTPTLMEFLIACEESRHLDPRTILNYRSQLRLPILHAFGIDLSSDIFSLLARSQFLRNPPTKQKVPQWSIDRVLHTFASEAFSLRTASLTNLLIKTLFLTALASGNRASELAATIRTGLSLSNDKAVLPTKPGFLFKNQSARNPKPPDITFPALGHSHTLCPVSALKIYRERTQAVAQKDYLFVHPTSGKPLGASRLSYWLARAIKAGDPEAIRPAGHDIRKMGHSIAHFRNAGAPEILANGFWHSQGVFIQKYLIPCRPTTHNFVAGRVTS